MRNTAACLAACAVLLSTGTIARSETVTFKISGSGTDRSPALVTMLVSVPDRVADATGGSLTLPDGTTLSAQLSAPGLRLAGSAPQAADGMAARQLTAILPSLPAKADWNVTLDTSTKPEASPFTWKDEPGKHRDLFYRGKGLIRYVYEPIQTTSPEERVRTYKPFHHVYDRTGEAFLTKGPEGMFTHHRGIYFGYNRMTYSKPNGPGGAADTWHCFPPAYQIHDAFIEQIAGPLMARQRVQILWHRGNDVMVTEHRELTFIPMDGGLVIDFCSRLTTDMKEVTLAGDPHHAGVQFRASNEVNAKTKAQTTYIRPDGTDRPGATRNWPDDKDQTNLPWKGQSIVFDGVRYTIAYLDHPSNPKPSYWGERDYGRFGSYFPSEVTPAKPLTANYRFFIREGELTGDVIAAKCADFVDGNAL